MSADNYYVVVKHPDGGYAAVMGFLSDDNPDLTPREHDPVFETANLAIDWASGEYSEYGVSVSEEVRVEMLTQETLANQALDGLREFHQHFFVENADENGVSLASGADQLSALYALLGDLGLEVK